MIVPERPVRLFGGVQMLGQGKPARKFMRIPDFPGHGILPWD
jgi:hypothetical protein